MMSSSNKLEKLKFRRILSSLRSICFLSGRQDDFSTEAFPTDIKVNEHYFQCAAMLN